jgi:hypothetical protein
VLRHHSVAVVISLVSGVILATGWPWWWPWVSGSNKESSPPTVATTASTTQLNAGVLRFAGGCTPYQIFAQNRWEPYGTAVRTGPDVRMKQISSFDGNHSIAVDGWVHSAVAYPTNTPPWNSDIWFHLADGSGWVSFAGVRAVPTTHDPTGFAKEGGQPAPTPARCQGSVQ